tara:strand:- start:1373 stop:1798 length:426 start_codon:yes stop_codon:yes gene_type:complete
MLIRIILVFLPSFLFSQTEICGKWLEEQKRSHIEIYQTQEDSYEGKIVWLAEPLDENGDIKKDAENPEPTLKEQPLKGLMIIKDLKYLNDNEWGDGEIYDARSGKTYSLNATLKDENKLFMRGYIGFSFIGKTTSWTRVIE